MSVKLIQLSLCLAFLLPTKLYGYAIRVHEDMSLAAYNQSSLSNYLPTIGLRDDQEFNGRTPAGWISEGSIREDDRVRFLNHFYDLTTGNGLSVGGLSLGTDAINWALELRDLGLGTLTQIWSIPDARNYFHTALTHPNQGVRSFNLASTFRALGHVIHLIQDMAQPQHVKNEIHPPLPTLPSRYERYTLNLRNGTINGTINELELSGYPTANFSNYISYWDALDGRGMSEVTHANFFPEREPIVCSGVGKDICSGVNYAQPTIFRSLGVNQSVEVQSLGDGIGISGQMKFFPHSFADPITGETVTNPRVLSESMFDLDLVEKHPNEDPVFSQNRFTFAESQKVLVKRSVGYSAGLINHFFRGQLEVSLPGSFVYGLIDGSVLPQQFTQITANVQNVTPGEEMGLGSLIAVARYKKRTNYQPDLSTDPPTAGSREASFSYSVSDPSGIADLSSTNPTDFIFDFSSQPIPAGITDLFLTVVYRGPLGQEDDAVAVGGVDLNEPMHITVWNATDYFYLDQVLNTADTIRGDPDLSDRVDFDNDGIFNELGISEPYIDPTDILKAITFYPVGGSPPSPHVVYDRLPPERYGRIILLSDQAVFFMEDRDISVEASEDLTFTFTVPGVVNQEDQNGMFNVTALDSFRGIDTHFWSAFGRFYPISDGISTAPWPDAEIIEAYPATLVNP